jgi:hypothetical protein
LLFAARASITTAAACGTGIVVGVPTLIDGTGFSASSGSVD